MKRRSQPKTKKIKDTYGKKLRSGKMMYGPRPHHKTHRRINGSIDNDWSNMV